ncbi:hypothetical protein [Streptomyces hebeiensis]
MKSDDSPEKARSLFQEKAKSWAPQDDAPLSFPSAVVCKARTDVTDASRELSLRYGPSTIFEFPFDKDPTEGERRNISIAPDVAMTYKATTYEPVRYRIYVRCKAPGAASGQEDKVPFTGELVDTLTGEPNARAHLTYLLQSARLMTETLGCENTPEVPNELPASVT